MKDGAPDLKLEVVVLPVSDVDRAKSFYEGLGWRLDADFATGPDFRVVQLTPPGSPTSIIFGTGVTSAAPGSIDALQLTVSDIAAARDQLSAGGADVSERLPRRGRRLPPRRRRGPRVRPGGGPCRLRVLRVLQRP